MARSAGGAGSVVHDEGGVAGEDRARSARLESDLELEGVARPLLVEDGAAAEHRVGDRPADRVIVGVAALDGPAERPPRAAAVAREAAAGSRAPPSREAAVVVEAAAAREAARPAAR